MSNNKLKIFSIIIIFANIFIIALNFKQKQNEISYQEIKEPKIPSNPDIKEYLFGYKTYDQIVSILNDWEKKAPDLVEIGTYGHSNKNKPLYYLKISNEYNPSKKVVLITACIHGNEPWSTSTVIAYAGKILSSYNKDEQLTKLVNERTIYVIPVVSPDSYPHSRSVDGVDPNRNFPTLKNPNKQSVKPIRHLQEFFLKIKPNSVLSGHTYGRVFLIPWGDSVKNNPNIKNYEKIASEMSKICGYKFQRACEMYNRPIYGTEIDWFHRNGSFAMVMEFGSHQRKPTLEETRKEFEKTFDGVVYFIRQSTEIDVKN
jgi:hypothetical protein